MSDSPIDQLLGAIESLDVDPVIALLAPDPRFLTADGRQAEGTEAVRELVGAVLGQLRSVTYKISAQWQVDGVSIAEVEVGYVLRDWLQINGLRRALVVRAGADGIADVRIYGAHEHPIADHGTGAERLGVGTRWFPPL